uniref:VASt domain-containing protein n=1 Tax=Zooxanthella nutricula TaxID=1333877 RepID=A0A7S2K0R5_9DINO
MGSRLVNAVKTSRPIIRAKDAGGAAVGENVQAPPNAEEESQRAAAESAPVLLKQMSHPASPKVHRTLSVDSRLSCVFTEAPEGRQPYEAPADKVTPIGSSRLHDVGVPRIAELFRGDDFLSKFLRDSKRARDLCMTPWSESRQAQGAFVRKCTGVLPVPQDFPKVVHRLVNLPSETRVSAMFRMHQQETSLVFSIHFCSHDVPFGESFHVHETIVFSPDSGTVQATNWVEIMWVKVLPWTHGILKAIIEQKFQGDALGSRLVKAIRNSCA